MNTLEELTAKYTDEKQTPSLDNLFHLLSINGTSKEKELIVDAYISEFCQCHYDYMCGKFNNLEWIWDTMNMVEKIKILAPNFDQYDFYKGHVYEMLSSVSKKEKDKIEFNRLCLYHLLRQQEYNEDVTVLIDIAQNIFMSCRLTNNYTKENFSKIKAFLLKAIHLERKEENKSGFFGFNGSAIDAILCMAYGFLGLNFDHKKNIHQEFILDFKKIILPYAKKDPSIYYHWAETLVRITDWVNYPKIETCRISQETVSDIWIEVKEILNSITNLQSNNEHFLTSIGHLFNKIAKKEVSFSYFEIAFNYYSKALKINDKTWSNPYYSSDALRNMAFIHLKKKEYKEAINLFNQGLNIFEEAQKKISDFQLSVYHADYLYDYAKYLENFSNGETLLRAKKQFEDSRVLGKNFYTSPFYGLAKTALRLGNKKEALKILKVCRKVFSNEYHTHRFDEIINDTDFEEIRKDLILIIE